MLNEAAPAVHFLLLNGLTAVAAWWAVVVCFYREEAWRRVLAALIAFGLLVEGAVLIVGTTAGFSLPILELFLFGVAAFLGYFARRVRRSAHVHVPAAETTSMHSRARTALAAGMAGAAAGGWTWFSLFQGTRFYFDDLTYHAAVPARWLQEGHIHLVPFTYQSYFPHNPDLLTLWFMLPFGTDAYASIGTLWSVAVLALSAFGLARKLGASSPASTYAAVLVACCSIVTDRLGGFARSDIAGAAASAAALAVVGPKPFDMLFSGLAGGFAVGSRVSYATVIPCIIAWWLAVARKTVDRRTLVRGLTILIITPAVAGGYWYLHNFVLTSNPLFPAQLGIFNGPFDSFTQARTQLATWIARNPADAAQWFQILARIDHVMACTAIHALLRRRRCCHCLRSPKAKWEDRASVPLASSGSRIPAGDPVPLPALLRNLQSSGRRSAWNRHAVPNSPVPDRNRFFYNFNGTGPSTKLDIRWDCYCRIHHGITFLESVAR